MPGVIVSADRIRERAHFESVTDRRGETNFAGLTAGDWQISGPSFGTIPTRPVRLTMREGASGAVHLLVSTKIIDAVRVEQ